jgi:hypothetical protein
MTIGSICKRNLVVAPKGESIVDAAKRMRMLHVGTVIVVDRSAADASSMYDKLEHTILRLFHQRRDGYTDVMRHAIALNGSFFNSHRMVEEYELKAYAA